MATQYAPSQRSQAQGPTRSKSMGRSQGSGKSGSGKKGDVSPPYRDVIDKLDLSGLLGGGFHHSGPFDAASSMQRSNAPIAAFSKAALDPTYSGSPNGTPLRDSSYPRQARAGGGGNGGGDGISARAKATLAAMGAESQFNDPNGSSENLLNGMPGHQRRNSENSITLGYPSNETDAKERKILEAFGVHSEAYLDYGNSSYARKPPRASVAPSPNSSMASFGSNPNSPTARQHTGMGKMTRADRTASIWDIEATLREGRPVGAAPPPPMPVIPDRFLQAPAPTSPPNSEPGVKRSKSLLSRMRSKKGAMISSPSPKDAHSDGNYFGNTPGAAPLPYQRSSSGQSLASDHGKERDSNDPFDNSAAVAAGSTPDYYQRLDDSFNAGQRPGMGSRSSTSPVQSRTSPVQSRMENNYLKPTMSSPPGSTYGDDGSDQQRRTGTSPRRSPQPPSPLGLPEGPGDIFGPSGGGMLKSSMSRSHKNNDLANESALAAVLAESSSKESGMTHSTSSSSNNSGYGYRNDGSGYGYAHTDTSYASDKTSTPDRSRQESLGNSTGSSSNASPADGGRLSRKTSLASRLLRGRAKRQS